MKKIGSWIIWDGDTRPHARQIVNIDKKNMYSVSILNTNTGLYTLDIGKCEKWQIDAARLCKNEEIPFKYRLLNYEIY